MSHTSVSAAVLSIAVVAVLAGPVTSAETCYTVGPCVVCCAEGEGGGCVYDIEDHACFCSCSPAGGSSEPRIPTYREPYCYYDRYGRYLCDWDRDAALAPVSPAFEAVPLETALSQVSRVFGVQIIAPALVSQYVRLSADTAGLGPTLDAIAEQVGAVRVVRGSLRVIELVPTADLAMREFSSASRSPLPRISVTFESADAIDALRLVAGAVKVDIAIPRGFSGRVRGAFTGTSWREVVRKIADSSAVGGGRIRVERTGLVQIER
jgi:hypothetical protein